MSQQTAPLKSNCTHWDPSAEERRRLGVVRGIVRGTDGETPFSGATVECVDDGACQGSATTNAQGVFGLVVRAGGRIRVRVDAGTNYLPVERTVHVPWLDTRWIEDVRLTEVPTNGTVEYGPSSGLVYDANSAQIVRIDHPSGTDACAAYAGNKWPIFVLIPHNVHACVPSAATFTALNNYGIGASNYTPTASTDGMPAPLPSWSAYTFAAEFLARDSNNDPAGSVLFREGNDCSTGSPARAYALVPDFLGLGAGTAIPSGAYTSGPGRWIPEADGRVWKITNGSGTVDLGDTPPADITTTELEAMHAALFPDGCGAGLPNTRDMWMVPLPHFSSWDFNLASILAWIGGITGPENGAHGEGRTQCNMARGGSIIECENRTLGERIPVQGTDFTLNYTTTRVPGMGASRRVTVPLMDSRVSGSTLRPTRVHVEIQVAGQRVRWSATGAEAQSIGEFHYDWDGRDQEGRLVQGMQRAYVRLGYEYAANYAIPGLSDGARFGNPPSATTTTVPTRAPTTGWSERVVLLGNWDARAQHLGGWTLDVHHAYDPVSRRIHLGNGISVDAEPIGPAMENFAGTGGMCGSPSAGENQPPSTAGLCFVSDVAVSRTGDVFFTASRRVRVVRSGATVLSSAVSFEDLNADVSSLAVDSEGNLYVYAKRSTEASGAIYRFSHAELAQGLVNASQTTHRVAGSEALPDRTTYERGFGPSVPLRVSAMTVDVDGTVLFTEHGDTATTVSRLRRLLQRRQPDGTLAWYVDHVVGGDNAPNDLSCPTGCEQRNLRFQTVGGVAVSDDGSIYVSDTGANTIFRLDRNGRAHVALRGNNAATPLPAMQSAAVACQPNRMVVDREGGLIFSALGAQQLRRLTPDGRVTQVAGTTGSQYCGEQDDCGNNGLARNARLGGSITGLAVAPDGSVYVIAGVRRVRRIAPQHPSYLPRATNGEPAITVPSPDGALHYVFDHRGQHRQTRLAQTNAILLQFNYTNDQLTSISDHLNRTLLAIAHTPTGAALTSPNNLETGLTFDSSGWLTEIRHPDHGTHTLGYHNSWGLLASFNPPMSLGVPTRFTYDSLGLLATDTDPAGRTVRLERMGTRGVRITTTATETTTTATEVDITRDPLGGDHRVVRELPTDRTESSLVGAATVGPYLRTPPGENTIFVPAGEVHSADSHGGTHRTVLGTATGLDGGVAPGGYASQVFPVQETIARAEGDASVSLQVNRSREVVAADGGPYDPPERIVDQVTTYPSSLGPDAGRTWSVSNDALRDGGVLVGRQLTVRSPEGRVRRIQTDLLDRVTFTRDGNRGTSDPMLPVTVGYASDSTGVGDTVTIQQGDSSTGRLISLHTSRSGRTTARTGNDVVPEQGVASVTGTQETGHHQFMVTRDSVNTTVHLNREGGLASVVTPSGTHAYNYNQVGALREYRPSEDANDQDQWQWSLDRRPSQWFAPTPSGSATGRHDVRFSYDNYRFPSLVWRADTGAPTDPILDYDFGSDGRLFSVSAWNPWIQGAPRVISSFTRYHGGLALREPTSLPGISATFVERGLDAWGRVASTEVRDLDVTIGGVISSSFDGDGVLSSVGALTLTPLRVSTGGPLDADGRLGSTDLGSSQPIRTRYEYDTNFGDPTVLETLRTTGSVQLHRESIQTRDRAGRILTMQEQWAEGATQQSCQNTYAYYPATGRLHTHTLDCNDDNLDDAVTFTYDNNGNRTGASHTGWTATAGPHTPRDQINSTFGPLEYTYTPRGSVRQIRYGLHVNEYVYDLHGSLVEVMQKYDNSLRRAIQYRNDAFGRRVSRSTVDCTSASGCASPVLRSVYVWDGALRVVGELRYPNGVSSTPVRYRYVYGTRVNAPDYVIQDGVIKYRLVHDHLGSVRFAYDATVTGTQGRHLSRRYDVLGALVAEDVSGVDLPFGFAGGLYDREAGFVDNAGAPVLVHGRNVALVRFGARDYDPFAGRWMAPDPIHFEGGDSNLYGYCGGDPVNRVDSDGRWWQYYAAYAVYGAVQGAAASAFFDIVGRCTENLATDVAWGAITGAVSSAAFARVRPIGYASAALFYGLSSIATNTAQRIGTTGQVPTLGQMLGYGLTGAALGSFGGRWTSPSGMEWSLGRGHSTLYHFWANMPAIGAGVIGTTGGFIGNSFADGINRQ